MYNIVSPPWNTLTACDLDTGVILWKLPIGEDPGVMTEQRGIIGTVISATSPVTRGNGHPANVPPPHVSSISPTSRFRFPMHK